MSGVRDKEETQLFARDSRVKWYGTTLVPVLYNRFNSPACHLHTMKHVVFSGAEMMFLYSLTSWIINSQRYLCDRNIQSSTNAF